MSPQTLKPQTDISSVGEWQGSSKQLRWGQMLMFPQRVDRSFVHLSTLLEKKSYLVIIGFL